ncbi:hypothetical protein GGI42DRAFT_328372 [Trichoderma sp. SZMC 28013]
MPQCSSPPEALVWAMMQLRPRHRQTDRRDCGNIQHCGNMYDSHARPRSCPAQSASASRLSLLYASGKALACKVLHLRVSALPRPYRPSRMLHRLFSLGRPTIAIQSPSPRTKASLLVSCLLSHPALLQPNACLPVASSSSLPSHCITSRIREKKSCWASLQLHAVISQAMLPQLASAVQLRGSARHPGHKGCHLAALPAYRIQFFLHRSRCSL